MTEAEYLMQQIDRLRLEYEKAAKPYVDRLIYLKSIELPKPNKFDPNESFEKEEANQARVREFMRNH